VPLRAQRVVTLGEALTGHVASVGLLPVAAPRDMVDWLTPYRDLLPGNVDLGSMQSIGTAEEPNLEVMARLAPDLIVLERDAMAFYPEFARIAPAVVIDRPSNAAWKEAFDQTVHAAGREPEAARVRQRYRDALDAVPAGAAQTVVTFLRGRSSGSFRIDGPGGFGGSVAEEAGFGVDEGGAGGEPSDYGYVTFSPERLSVADGDLLVIPTRAEGPSSTAELEKSPLWAQLPAVHSGSVLGLPNSVYNGGTYVAAELLVGALSRAVGSA
jgi:iron complex transport system substrate-binding protein